MCKLNHLFCVFFILLLLSCDNERNEDLNVTLPKNVKDIPELSVFGTTAVIETYTELNIEIKHVQDVNTSLLIDDNIIFTSTSKNFNFDLNPYLFTIGNHKLKIFTEDKDGNKNDLSFDIEIKHLLMLYEYGNEENSLNPYKWIFFNDLEGNLLTQFKSTPGLNKIYTDKVITTNNILYSVATYTHNIDGDSKNLNVTTTRISIGKERSPIYREDIPNFTNELKINVNLIEPKSMYTLFWGSGTQYRVVTTGGGGYLESINFHFDNTNDIYVRYDGFSGRRILNGEFEDYKYLRFNPTPGYTEVEINESDFISPESTISLEIPEHEPGSMTLSRYGFLNDLDIELNNNHLIYYVAEESNYNANFLNLPVLSGLNQYRNVLSYEKDNNYFTVTGFDDNYDIIMPNWSIEVSFLDNFVSINASNEEVDFYALNYNKSINSDNSNYRNLNWYYRTFSNDSPNFSLPKLELPKEITDTIGESYFESTSDMELTGIYAFDYDHFNTYQEFINYSTYIQTNLSIRDLSYKKISFPIDSYSGKLNNKFYKDDYILNLD